MLVIMTPPMIKLIRWRNLFNIIDHFFDMIIDHHHIFLGHDFLGKDFLRAELRGHLCVPAIPSRQVFPEHLVTPGFNAEVTWWP